MKYYASVGGDGYRFLGIINPYLVRQATDKVEICNMSNEPKKTRYVVTMYADDDRKIVFYQFSIGMLTEDQLAIFLRDGSFRSDGTKECTCCNGAIYVVHARLGWDSRVFPITNPGSDIDRDAEFNKAQTAWDMLREEPLYMKATETAYQRREKIYLDARFLQRLAKTIRRNHPTPKIPPPPPKNNSSTSGLKQPGRRPEKLYDWLMKKKLEYEKIGQDRTTKQLAEEFNRLTSNERADIGGKLLNRFSQIEIPSDSTEYKKWRDKIDQALQRRAKNKRRNKNI